MTGDRSIGNERSHAYEALWPGGPIGVPTVAPAPRPASLDGKTIAFVWDYVFRGEEIFPALRTGLTEAFGSASFVGYDSFGSIFGGDEEAVLAGLPDRLRDLKVDAVVTGVGC